MAKWIKVFVFVIAIGLPLSLVLAGEGYTTRQETEEVREERIGRGEKDQPLRVDISYLYLALMVVTEREK